VQKTQGTKVKETKNAIQYQTTWGPFYMPKTVVAALGDPLNITLTVEDNDS